MKRHLIMHINLFVSSIIILGFISIAFVNYYTYSRIIKDDIENISKLTSTNIYSDVNNELTKPIFVSLTMANDTFLKSWLSEEKEMIDNEAYIQELQDYLIGIKQKYDYNSVFLVSEETNNYYHYEGVQKKISEENAHDKWYYTFIESKQIYDLDVDKDEVANNVLTVFVNCRLVASDGTLLGVVGVGVKLDQVQSTLKRFEDDFNLEAFMIDPTGLIQIHTDNGKIEEENIFNESSMTQFQERIIYNYESLESCRFQENGLDGYLITKYVNELDWYLVVKKDTSILVKSFHLQIARDLVIILIVLALLLILSTCAILQYKKQTTKLIKTDELTNLPNRRAFNENLQLAIDHYEQSENIFNVYVLDIDNFKKINDTYGHLFGDHTITKIGHIADDIVGHSGMTARWGGDEFSGIINGTMEEAEKIASNIVATVNQLDEFQKYGITVSLGVTQIKRHDSFDSLMFRADCGLYKSKENGRNRVTAIMN